MRNQWHDLEDNAEDLPQHALPVLVHRKSGAYEVTCYFVCSCGSGWIGAPANPVDAWRLIDEFHRGEDPAEGAGV